MKDRDPGRLAAAGQFELDGHQNTWHITAKSDGDFDLIINSDDGITDKFTI